MTESSEPSSADEGASQSTEDDAPGADEMEETVQRGGDNSAPPIEFDTIQHSDPRKR